MAFHSTWERYKAESSNGLIVSMSEMYNREPRFLVNPSDLKVVQSRRNNNEQVQ